MSKRLTVRWDVEMGCYRVNEPNWEGGVVVPVEVHDAEIEQLKATSEALRAKNKRLLARVRKAKLDPGNGYD